MKNNTQAVRILIGTLCFFVVIFMVFCLYFFKSYPLNYKNIIRKYATEFGVPVSVVASVINVESDFVKDSYSNAGAKGLMQLMDKTADEIAYKLNESNYDLFDAETNIKFGVFYLKYLIDYYDANVFLALCAYNAGLSNVNKWIKEFELDESNIPFSETKKYIKKIKTSKLVYEKFYGFK